uniref:Uncharacterized protein n=1 Tax=Zea mays TaxID=4577 RepID=C0PI99_MAIZE|nr:unknown [Zea mays]|eukprot:NP_001169788.1 uncharacterized protein LOC100383678 [Zea mays]
MTPPHTHRRCQKWMRPCRHRCSRATPSTTTRTTSSTHCSRRPPAARGLRLAARVARAGARREAARLPTRASSARGRGLARRAPGASGRRAVGVERARQGGSGLHSGAVLARLGRAARRAGAQSLAASRGEESRERKVGEREEQRREGKEGAGGGWEDGRGGGHRENGG